MPQIRKNNPRSPLVCDVRKPPHRPRTNPPHVIAIPVPLARWQGLDGVRDQASTQVVVDWEFLCPPTKALRLAQLDQKYTTHRQHHDGHQFSHHHQGQAPNHFQDRRVGENELEPNRSLTIAFPASRQSMMQPSHRQWHHPRAHLEIHNP